MDELGERLQEPWMQTRFWFVQHEKGRWARRKQSCDKEQVAKSAVGEVGGTQGSKEPGLADGDREHSRTILNVGVATWKDDLELIARKGPVDDLVEVVAAATLDNGLKRSSQIVPVGAEDGRPRSDPALSRRSIRVSPEMVVEAP